MYRLRTVEEALRPPQPKQLRQEDVNTVTDVLSRMVNLVAYQDACRQTPWATLNARVEQLQELCWSEEARQKDMKKIAEDAQEQRRREQRHREVCNALLAPAHSRHSLSFLL